MYRIFAGGEYRWLGNHQGQLRHHWRPFGSVPEEVLIPRSQWGELLDAIGDGPDNPYLPPVHDQDGVGQCNADATVAAMEYARAVQGLPLVLLSAADLYQQINGGQDNGSLLEDGIRAAMASGVGTAESCGTIWKRGQYRPADRLQRLKYRVLEACLCPTFDHFMSAVLHGWGLISGVMWYENYNPDRDGWLPEGGGGGGGGGHAVFGYKPARRGTQWGIWHQNSWSERWGLSGRCVFPESMYRGPVGGWWAVRQLVTEGGDVPSPDFDN